MLRTVGISLWALVKQNIGCNAVDTFFGSGLSGRRRVSSRPPVRNADRWDKICGYNTQSESLLCVYIPYIMLPIVPRAAAAAP
jgi:hypothetical protein